MISRLYIIAATLLIGVISIPGCGQRPPIPATSNKLQVAVSIAPQQYFVERIGEDHVDVDVMVPPGAEPHTFEPKPEQLKALSQADAYMRIHIDFEEAWISKFVAANSEMLIVDTTQGIQRVPMLSGFNQTEAAHRGGEENLDPHIWLSPRLVKIQAQTIYNALVQLDAEHQAVYQDNLEDFLADIDALDTEIRQKLQGIQNRKFVVFHPGWSYFALDYDLEMIPIEVGGQEPSAAELGVLITEAKQENIKIVFAEPQFSKQAADTIAEEIGGEVLLIDPLSPNWLNNLREVANTFSKELALLKYNQYN
jgi:zinc transport system substrate-binding protein